MKQNMKEKVWKSTWYDQWWTLLKSYICHLEWLLNVTLSLNVKIFLMEMHMRTDIKERVSWLTVILSDLWLSFFYDSQCLCKSLKGNSHLILQWQMWFNFSEVWTDMSLLATDLIKVLTFTFTFSHLADAFIQSDLQLGVHKAINLEEANIQRKFQ